MDVIISEAVEHIAIESLGPRQKKFAFPRLSPEVQSLYRDLRVDLSDLLVFYPEFLDVRTEIAMHALFTGFEEGALGLFDMNREISRKAMSSASASACAYPWESGDNRPYLRSTREHAYALCRVGQIDQAMHLASEVVAHDAEDRTGARAVLAHAQLEAGQYARALELTAGPSSSGNLELALARVLACLALGWQEEAFYSLAEAYRSWPAVVEEVIRDGPTRCSQETLIYPVTEIEQAERYALDYFRLWEDVPGAMSFVRRFLGARA